MVVDLLLGMDPPDWVLIINPRLTLPIYCTPPVLLINQSTIFPSTLSFTSKYKVALFTVKVLDFSTHPTIREED